MSDFSNIIAEINTNLPDNNTQQITAKKLRDTLIDLTGVIDENMDDFESNINQDFSDLSTNLTDDISHYKDDIDYTIENLVVDNLTTDDGTKALSAKQGMMLQSQSTVIRLVGNGNTAVTTTRFPLITGHKYKFVLQNENIGISEATPNTTIILRLQNFDASSGTPIAGNYVDVTKSQGLSKEYEFTADENNWFRIYMKANAGEEQVFTLIDTTYKTKVVDDFVNTSIENALSVNRGAELNKKMNDEIISSSEIFQLDYTTTANKLINPNNGNQSTISSQYYFMTSEIDVSMYEYIEYCRYVSVKSATVWLDRGMAFYDANHNYVSGESFLKSETSTSLSYADQITKVPENAKYARFTIYTQNPSVVFFVNGLIKNVDENLVGWSLMDYDIVDGGGIVYNTGLASGSNYRTNYIDVEGEKQLLYSRVRSNSSTTTLGMAFYNSSKTYIGGERCIYGISYDEDPSRFVTSLIDVPANAKYARFTVWSTDRYGKEFFVKHKGLEKNFLYGKKISILGDSITCFGTETMTREQGYNSPYWIVKEVDVGATIKSWVTWLDVYQTIDTSTLINKTIGNVLITPQMIGTYQSFRPVAEDVGKAIGVPRWASSYTQCPWWRHLINKTGATLCSNASWSGSRIVEIPVGSPRHDSFVLSEAYSDYTIGRLKTRDDDGNTVKPDVIIITRGINDFMGKDPEGGTGTPDVEDIDTPDMMTFDYDNFDAHNFTEGYLHTINKIRENYPDAYIVLCTYNVIKYNATNWPPNNGTYTLVDYNNKVREIANIMGCGLIEFDKDGITFENCYPTYISDNAATAIHPNSNGHRVMGNKAYNDLKYTLNVIDQ